MNKKSNDAGASMEISRPNIKTIDVAIIGHSPLILNSMSEKARHELLLPKGRKSNAEKAQNLKHQPMEEYRKSVYSHRGDDVPTRIYFPAGGFKKAMMSAAVDLPGATKSSIGRLVWVAGDKVNVYGIPQIFMSITRSADMARTPDVRTRAIIPHWACMLKIQYASPALGDVQIGNLLMAAGMFIGVGDWRQEKGSASFGQFSIVTNETHEQFEGIINGAGRIQQDAALANPATYDSETDDLLAWFNEEVAKMGDRGVAMGSARSNGKHLVGVS